jgi:hypothetical protein
MELHARVAHRNKDKEEKENRCAAYHYQQPKVLRQ